MNTIDGERTSKLIDVSLDRQSPLLKQIEQRAEPLIEKIADEKKKTLLGNSGIIISLNMLAC